MSAPIVFFDIAGSDEGELRNFYTKVFDWPAGTPGNFTPGNLPIVQANIRQDPAQKVIYVGVKDIKTTLDDIVEAGGKIDVPRFEVSGVAVLGLFFDPAGNRMGLVEMLNGKPLFP